MRNAQPSVGKNKNMDSSSKKRVFMFAGFVLLILVVVIVFLFYGQGAGRAYYNTPTSVGTGGFQGNPVDLTNKKVGDILSFIVGANLATGESVAYGFDLKYPSDKLQFEDVTTLRDGDPAADTTQWGTDLKTVDSATSGVVKFSDVTLNYNAPLKGTVQLATVNFKVIVPLTDDDLKEGKMDFTDLYVLSVTDSLTNLVISVKNPSNEQFVLPQNCDQASVCNGHVDLDAVTSTQMNNLCVKFPTICKDNVVNADLNGDGKVNDGDIIIIQLAMLSAQSDYPSCGAANQKSCLFSGINVCENLKNSYTQQIACGGSQ